MSLRAAIQPQLTGDRCRCSGPPYRGCGEVFNSTAAFDKHRVGPYYPLGMRRCLTVAEMTAKGMERNAAGFWLSGKRWQGPPRPSGEGVPAAIELTPIQRTGVDV